MTVGIFGGSFNPVHNGHIKVATTIVERDLADEVWLIVSPLNPIKANPEALLPDNVRLEMARIAVDGLKYVKASDIELTLPRPSYTINTLRRLSEIYPSVTFRLIIGSDNMLIFDKWKSHEEIMSAYTPIVYPRPGYECNLSLKNFPEMAVSSSEVRERLKNGLSVDTLLSPGVYGYIKQHHLYGVK